MIWPLIGQKKDCSIVEEVIGMDEMKDVNTNPAEEKYNKYGKVELSFAKLR